MESPALAGGEATGSPQLTEAEGLTRIRVPCSGIGCHPGTPTELWFGLFFFVPLCRLLVRFRDRGRDCRGNEQLILRDQQM